MQMKRKLKRFLKEIKTNKTITKIKKMNTKKGELKAGVFSWLFSELLANCAERNEVPGK